MCGTTRPRTARLARRFDDEPVAAARYDGDNAAEVRCPAGVTLRTAPDPPRLRVGGAEVRPGGRKVRDADGRVDLVRASEHPSRFRAAGRAGGAAQPVSR